MSRHDYDYFVTRRKDPRYTLLGLLICATSAVGVVVTLYYIVRGLVTP